MSCRPRALVLCPLVAASLLLGACATPAPAPAPGATARETAGVETLMRLADATLAGGDAATAFDLLRRAAAMAPADVAPRLALADAYYAAYALTEARVAYAALVDEAPLEAALGLGRIALATANPAAALEHFAAARALDPDDVRTINGLAVAHDLAGRHGEAQALYGEALTLDPTNRPIANNLALSHVLSGETDRAIEALRALALGPLELTQARHNLALAYGIIGDEAAAERLIEPDLGPDEVAQNLLFYRTARQLAGVAPAGGG